MVKLHPHVKERMAERGATEDEIVATVENGETFQAKFGRIGFRRNFHFNGIWRGRQYATKQIEIIAVKENNNWIVITVITRYF